MQRFNIREYIRQIQTYFSTPGVWKSKKVIGGIICCFILFVSVPLFILWYKAQSVGKVQQPITAKEIVPSHVSGQLIVAFKDGESPDNFLKTAPKEFGFTGYEKVFPKETASTLANYYLFRFSKQEDIQAIKAYVQKRPEVRSVEFNKLMSFDAIPPTPFSVNDTFVGSQWALGAIDVGQAWSILQKTPIQERKKVIVAIIDSGVDYNHEDLSNGQVIKGGDFATDEDTRAALGKSGDSMDILGHGTAIAGIIGATTNNYKGVAGVSGVSGVVSLLAVKTEGTNGLISTNDSARAISSAIEAGAKVINLSFGSPASCSKEYQDLFNAHKDVVFVAAAGNGLCPLQNGGYAKPDPETNLCPGGVSKVGLDISRHSHDPASCNGVIAVASVDENYIPAVTSNWGQKVALAAPGVGIITTRASACPEKNCGPVSTNPLFAKYVFLSGTSFSAPYVSGAAALLLAKYPTLSAAQVKECLVRSGENIVRIRPNQPVGPLLDVGNALRDCPTILATTRETVTPSSGNQTTQIIDTLDYFISKHQNQGLTGTHQLSQVIDQADKRAYYIKWQKDGDPAGKSSSFEVYTWDENNIYLNEDHGEGLIPYYSLAPGTWMKRHMQIGQTITLPNQMQVYNNDCQSMTTSGILQTGPFSIEMTLEKEDQQYNLGGDLGKQDVIVLKKYDLSNADGTFERFYYSKDWGWVKWEQYNRIDPNTPINTSTFNHINQNPLQPLATAACTPKFQTLGGPINTSSVHTPSPMAVVEIKDAAQVGNADTSGKLICSPVGGMGNKLNANAIQVTNGTGNDIAIWYQSNLCDYASTLALVEGYQCNTFKGRAEYTVPKDQTKIFTLGIPSCTVGQLDINVVDLKDKGCYRPDDTSKLWDGGLAFAIQVNKNACGVPTPTIQTLTPTLGVSGNDAAGFLRDNTAISIPTPTPRTCTQPQVRCSNTGGSVQMCSFTCE